MNVAALFPRHAHSGAGNAETYMNLGEAMGEAMVES